MIGEIERTWLARPSPLFPFHGAVADAFEGLGCRFRVGPLSGALTQLVYACEDGFRKRPLHWMWWPVLGGLVVGLGGLIDTSA